MMKKELHLRILSALEDLSGQTQYAGDYSKLLKSMQACPARDYYLAVHALEEMREQFDKYYLQLAEPKIKRSDAQKEFEKTHFKEIAKIQQQFAKVYNHSYGETFAIEQVYFKTLIDMYYAHQGSTLARTEDAVEQYLPNLIKLANENNYAPAQYKLAKILIDIDAAKYADEIKNLYVRAAAQGYKSGAGAAGASYLSHLSQNVSLPSSPAYQFAQDPENSKRFLSEEENINLLLEAIDSSNIEAVAYAQNFLSAADAARKALEQVEKGLHQHTNAQKLLAEKMVKAGEKLVKKLIEKNIINKDPIVTTDKHGIKSLSYEPSKLFNPIPFVADLVEKENKENIYLPILKDAEKMLGKLEEIFELKLQELEKEISHSTNSEISETIEEEISSLISHDQNAFSHDYKVLKALFENEKFDNQEVLIPTIKNLHAQVKFMLNDNKKIDKNDFEVLQGGLSTLQANINAAREQLNLSSRSFIDSISDLLKKITYSIVSKFTDKAEKPVLSMQSTLQEMAELSQKISQTAKSSVKQIENDDHMEHVEQEAPSIKFK